MYKFPDTPKKIKQRIASYRRAMQKELDTHGMVSDGYGKRYLLFFLHFLLNDHEKSAEYFEWFEDEFPADIGEPIMYLCWAVMLNRMGRSDDAGKKLAMLMLSNIYFIPFLLDGDPGEWEDMWYRSNFDEIDYVDDLPDQVLMALDESDLEWIDAQYLTAEFKRIRKTHIEVHKDLLYEMDPAKRAVLLDIASAQWEYLYGMPFELMNN